MSLTPEHGRSQGELSFAYGHESKKVRLRAVGAEKESYLKYIDTRLAKKISLAQLVLAIVIGITQTITIGMVVGQYSYDVTAQMGAGIWTSMIVFISALETLWSLKNAKYWKLHLSFALHIISMLVLIILACSLLGGTIPELRRKLAMVMFPDKPDATESHRYYYNDPSLYSSGLLITSLLLNSTMALATLGQLLGSFLMTLMTGRSICCGSNKATGKLFELEIAGSDTKDGGILVVKKPGTQTIKPKLDSERTGSTSEEPPPYSNSVAVVQSADVLSNII